MCNAVIERMRACLTTVFLNDSSISPNNASDELSKLYVQGGGVNEREKGENARKITKIQAKPLTLKA
jgi:hypothetical protein